MPDYTVALTLLKMPIEAALASASGKIAETEKRIKTEAKIQSKDFKGFAALFRSRQVSEAF